MWNHTHGDKTCHPNSSCDDKIIALYRGSTKGLDIFDHAVRVSLRPRNIAGVAANEGNARFKKAISELADSLAVICPTEIFIVK